MKFKKKKLNKLLEELNQIKEKAIKYERKYSDELKKVHPNNLKSAKNFVHYLALRNRDVRELQDSLWQLGISRLGRAESHVMASIISLQNILQGIMCETPDDNKPDISFKKGKKILKANTSALLGKKLKGSNVRIMVTMPSEAAYDFKLVKKLFIAGMNSARINCAHDNQMVWGRIIENVRNAHQQTGKCCRICMDLAGPKLRTGKMREGPKVVHLTPERDLLGKVTSPAAAWLVPDMKQQSDIVIPRDEDENLIPVSPEFLSSVRMNDEIYFSDSRDKRKKLIAGKKRSGRRQVHCFESAYIQTGTVLELKNKKTGSDMTASIGELQPIEDAIILKQGDKLQLIRDNIPGEPAEYNESGELLRSAFISCTLPEIFKDLKTGEIVILDDGKIEGIIEDADESKFELKITHAKEGGTKLKADKGINFPESNLSISGFTQKDREDLEYVAKNADVVNASFINSPEDVTELLKELKKHGAEKTGIIIKIETKKAFESLPMIILTAMQHHPVGVMIARGDLAIECGWKDLAQIQEEIMRLCEAAHLPIVWATQVMETMAKKGRPSRAEITDAAFAEQAESVMLNKGPYIFETIKILDSIMSSMQPYQYKKSSMLPLLKMKDKAEKP